MRNELQAKQ